MNPALHTAPFHSPVSARRAPWAAAVRPTGDAACRQTWERIRGLDARTWLALPAARGGAWRTSRLLVQEAMAASLPHPALAREVERALERGIRASTAPALLAMAALAHARYDGGAAALDLAGTALRIATGRNDGEYALVRAMHAGLVLPATAGLAQAAGALVALGDGKALPPTAACYLGSAALAAGMPVPELSHHLETARRHAGANNDGADADAGAILELESRANLLRGLLSRQGSAQLARLSSERDPAQDRRFGHRLVRLQAAWYAGEPALARDAIDAAGALRGPLTPTADLLLYHVFAALTLSCFDGPAALASLGWHCAALHSLEARGLAGDGALVALADAARERSRGNMGAALRGFETAAASALRHGLHWAAALAFEQAAVQAAEAGLDSAARHYRHQALACNRRWGALGRADDLQAAWRKHPAFLGDDDGITAAFVPASAGTAGLGMPIAHELNQPLAAITLHAAAARKWLCRSQPDIERALDSLSLIGQAGRQAGAIVRGMQRLAACQEYETGMVDVDQAVREALQLLRRPLRKQQIDVALALDLAGVGVEANRAQLQQVVVNLVTNAIEAHAAGGGGGAREIRIETRRCGEHEIELAVSDNGPGIALPNREHVFTSFFSTKPRPSTDGAGMGLSISLSIVRAHGGHLWFEPCAPHGACFRLRLPMHAGHAPA
jgi:anti-sigma regulatory factor (Ser/Thr protein kinase)